MLVVVGQVGRSLPVLDHLGKHRDQLAWISVAEGVGDWRQGKVAKNEAAQVFDFLEVAGLVFGEPRLGTLPSSEGEQQHDEEDRGHSDRDIAPGDFGHPELAHVNDAKVVIHVASPSLNRGKVGRISFGGTSSSYTVA